MVGWLFEVHIEGRPVELPQPIEPDDVIEGERVLEPV